MNIFRQIDGLRKQFLLRLSALEWATVIAIALILSSGSPALAYTETYQGGLEQHSTFHYELTRALMRTAGFAPADAEQIAVTTEAVDSITFAGYSDLRVRLSDIRRVSQYGQYWHFPRAPVIL